MTALDTAIFVLLNDVLGHDRIAVEVGYFLADYAPTAIISVLAAYFFVETRRRHQVRVTLLVAFLAASLAWVISVLLVDSFFRPRPFTVVEGAHLLISTSRDSSFPNVTTAWCAAVALTTLRTPHKLLRGFVLGTALLFGLSRPLLGDHWPSDIVASFILGGVASYIAVQVAGAITPVTEWFLRAVNKVEERWLD